MEGEREETPMNAEPQGRSMSSEASNEQQPTALRSTLRSKGSEKPMKCGIRGSSGTYSNLLNKIS